MNRNLTAAIAVVVTILPGAPLLASEADAAQAPESAAAEAAEEVPGYRIVERDGVKRYCRTRAPTGSHLRREKTCLTRAELDELKERSKDFLRNSSRPRPPPQEKPGLGG
jgi:hypothetical protein